jgi:histidinol-phosphate phosphatase family protein
MAVNRAVFIDRDGTVAKDVPYCSRPEDFELLPKVGEGIRLLNESGFKVIMVTNQSGIARGYFTEGMLGRIHNKMRQDLAQYGAHIDAIYYCPHHPDDGCECRRPKPALIYRAAKEHDIELNSSFFIGDQGHDVEAGHSAGCKTALISPAGASKLSPLQPDFVACDFCEACHWVAGK